MKHLILLIAALGLCSTAFAFTNVGPGPVSGNWHSYGSPYLVQGDIYVAADSCLIIEPGVEVRFQGHYWFKVLQNATLIALGNQAEWILFTAENQAQGWFGLRFENATGASRLQFCHFIYGKANGPTGPPDYFDGGGAIMCYQSSPTILYCKIDSCEAYKWGGGIFTVSSQPIIQNCWITANVVTDSSLASYGGGICLALSSGTLVKGNIIDYNHSAGRGGGIKCLSSDALILNNLIVGNSAQYWGGGIGIFGGVVPRSIVNNTLVNNSAGPSGGGAIHSYSTGSTCRIVNCIAWGNSLPSFAGSGALPITTSDIEGVGPGGGSLNVPPQFASHPPYGDFFLGQPPMQPQSPCVDAGTALYPLSGTTATNFHPDGGPIDMGYHYTWFWPPVDQMAFASPTQTDATWLWFPDDLMAQETPAQTAAIQSSSQKMYNSPNPFNPSTTISYELRDASFVKLAVYDMAGREVARLVNGWRESGAQEVTFDGSSLPSGVYIYRLKAGDFTTSGKMMLMK